MAFFILKSTFDKNQQRTSLLSDAVRLKQKHKKKTKKIRKFVSYQHNVLNNIQQKAAT